LLVLLLLAAARIVSYLVSRCSHNAEPSSKHRPGCGRGPRAALLLGASRFQGRRLRCGVGHLVERPLFGLYVVWLCVCVCVCVCVCGCAWELALGRTSWRSPNTVMQAALCLRRWHRTPRSTSRLSLERRLAWVARTTGSRSRSTTTYVHRTCRSRQQRLRGGAHSMARAEELWLRGRLVLDQGLVR